MASRVSWVCNCAQQRLGEHKADIGTVLNDVRFRG
jgi:hypothetical protein